MHTVYRVYFVDLADPDDTPPFLLLQHDWKVIPAPRGPFSFLSPRLIIPSSFRVGETRLVQGEGSEVAVAQWGGKKVASKTPLIWDTETWTGGVILPRKRDQTETDGETRQHVVTLLLSAGHAVTLNTDTPPSKSPAYLQAYTRAESDGGKRGWNPSTVLSDIELKLHTFACLSGGDLTVLNGQRLYKYDLNGRGSPKVSKLRNMHTRVLFLETHREVASGVLWMGTVTSNLLGYTLHLWHLEEHESGLVEKKAATTPLDSIPEIGQVELKFCRSDAVSSAAAEEGPLYRAVLRVEDKIYVVWRKEDPDVVEVGRPEATGVAAFCPAPRGALLLRRDTRSFELLKLRATRDRRQTTEEVPPRETNSNSWTLKHAGVPVIAGVVVAVGFAIAKVLTRS